MLKHKNSYNCVVTHERCKEKIFSVFDHHKLPDNSNFGSTNGESLKQDYLFVQPIDRESMKETCLKSVIVFATPFQFVKQVKMLFPRT